MDEAERAFVESLIQTNRSHLQVLEQQAAAFGIMAPPYIVTQIAEYRQKLAELEGKLRPATIQQKDAPRHNLPPRDYERFVGREKELIEVRRLLGPKSRAFVVTVDGIGGIGKSALVLESAYELVEQYNSLPESKRFEAIVWVSAKRTYLTASGIRERRQVFRTLEDLFTAIARVLDEPAITNASAQNQRTSVEQVLREQRTLLILDNLETVDDDDLLDFLHELPEPTKALVTTRHRIDVARPVRLTGMAHRDALDLIAQEASRKDVMLIPEEQEELWQRTGGVPLAIVWSIGLMGLGGSVESVLRRLGSGQSDIARFCFEQSVQQIRRQDAYRLLLVLSLFEASVNRSMLGDIAGLGEDIFGRDRGLEDLVRLSLVNREGDRFSLLPLTRTYGLEELANAPELEHKLRERQIKILSELAEPYAGSRWRWRDGRPLLQEGLHLVGLANWCQLTNQGDLLLRILPALNTYYDLNGQWSDALNISRVGLEYARLLGNTEMIVSLQISPMMWVLRSRRMFREAEECITNAISTAKIIGDTARLCDALVEFSRLFRTQGATDRALVCCQEALAIISDVDEEYQVYARASIEHELGRIARDQRDWLSAQRHFQHALDLYSQNTNDPIFLAEVSWGALGQLGNLAREQGDFGTAAQYYRQAVDYCRSSEARAHLSNLLMRLAHVEERCGNLKEARAIAVEALELAHTFRLRREQADAEALLAKLAEHSPEPAQDQ